MIYNFKITAICAETSKEVGMTGNIEAATVTKREAKLICDELIKKDTRIMKSIKFELEGKIIYEEVLFNDCYCEKLAKKK